MHGLVWEWCLDSFGPYDAADADDPRGPRRGDRCLRGGAFHYGADWCRSAYRVGFRPSGSYDDIGFRVLFPAPADGA